MVIRTVFGPLECHISYARMHSDRNIALMYGRPFECVFLTHSQFLDHHHSGFLFRNSTFNAVPADLRLYFNVRSCKNMCVYGESIHVDENPRTVRCDAISRFSLLGMRLFCVLWAELPFERRITDVVAVGWWWFFFRSPLKCVLAEALLLGCSWTAFAIF